MISQYFLRKYTVKLYINRDGYYYDDTIRDILVNGLFKRLNPFGDSRLYNNYKFGVTGF